MREVWFYSMFDADGNLLHEGTAAELVEKGLFKEHTDRDECFLMPGTAGRRAFTA